MNPSFIPKPYKKLPITIRIDVQLLEEIEKRCAIYGTNRTEFINQCITFALQHMPEDSSAAE